MDEFMLKRRENGLLLTDEDIEILKKYNFDYTKYSDLNSLIYDIEYYLNANPNSSDLDYLSSVLSEMNYYQNTNK